MEWEFLPQFLSRSSSSETLWNGWHLTLAIFPYSFLASSHLLFGSLFQYPSSQDPCVAWSLQRCCHTQFSMLHEVLAPLSHELSTQALGEAKFSRVLGWQASHWINCQEWMMPLFLNGYLSYPKDSHLTKERTQKQTHTYMVWIWQRRKGYTMRKR